jgi:RNA polymerase sigma factor (TIGR02999 family)
MARFFFQRESETHTLQATVLVSELYFLLRKQRKTTWSNRKAFFGFAAEVMRHFLVDYARKRDTCKRGGQVTHVAIERIATLVGRESDLDLVLDLQRALDELADLDPQQARVVELRFLLGLQLDETAEALGVSQPTVKRKWRSAKLWLMRRLSPDEPARTDAGDE